MASFPLVPTPSERQPQPEPSPQPEPQTYQQFLASARANIRTSAHTSLQLDYTSVSTPADPARFTLLQRLRNALATRRQRDRAETRRIEILHHEDPHFRKEIEKAAFWLWVCDHRWWVFLAGLLVATMIGVSVAGAKGLGRGGTAAAD